MDFDIGQLARIRINSQNMSFREIRSKESLHFHFAFPKVQKQSVDGLYTKAFEKYGKDNRVVDHFFTPYALHRLSSAYCEKRCNQGVKLVCIIFGGCFIST